MRVAVLGAGGLLGRHVVEELAGHEVAALDRRACDVTRLDELVAATRGAALIVNCAGFTNVDAAESREDEAFLANAIGAENAARAARAHDASLIHVSTDFVFDGAQPEPYDELVPPRPLSVYGRSKWAGERLVERVTPRVFLVRLQGLYGAGGANFASRLPEMLRAGRPLRLDGERLVQPTSARAAARQLLRLATTDAHGTYHVSCGGRATWAEFAEAVAALLGVPPRFERVCTRDLQSAAPRPHNSLFRRRMLALRGLDIMPDWQAALREYLGGPSGPSGPSGATR